MRLLKMDTMGSRADDMERIMSVLRSGTDTQSTNILARLRLGEKVDEVAKNLPAVATFAVTGTPPRYKHSCAAG
jgi:hypothetical protein